MVGSVRQRIRILQFGLCAASFVACGACHLWSSQPGFGDVDSGADGVPVDNIPRTTVDSWQYRDSGADSGVVDTSQSMGEDGGGSEPVDTSGGSPALDTGDMRQVDTVSADSGELDSGTPPDAVDTCGSEETCNGEDDDCDGTVDEGCPCVYDPTEADRVDTDGSHKDGVCTGQTLDSNGTCTEPSAFESTESRCSDGHDNDCDGASDFDDLDCKKPAGSACSDSKECLGLCKSFSGATGTVCTHRIFVTSKEWTGDLGGISGGDQKCNQLAAAQNLGGTWEAILSSPSVHAKDRIVLTGQLFNLNGTRIAENESDLWDKDLDAAIERDETNSSRATLVWTGTLPNGKWDGSDGEDTPDDCGGDWGSASSSEDGEVGYSADASDNWTHDGDGVSQHPCDKRAALYCVDGQ